MVQYRVIYNEEAAFGCNLQESIILESNSPIGRKEIAFRLAINDDNIISIDVL
jgi:hypothetical protein